MQSINLLDMRTLLMCNIVSCLVCSVVVALFWKQNRDRFPATAYWLRGLLFETVALSLVLLRGEIPGFVSYIVSNAMIVCGLLQFHDGLKVYLGRKVSPTYNCGILAAFVVLQLVATYAFPVPSILYRNVNLSAFLVLICGQCAWLMWFRVPQSRRPGAAAVGWVMAIYCVLNIARTVLYGFVPPENDFFLAGYSDALLLLAYLIMFFALTSSLLLMVIRRLYVELEHDVVQSRLSEASARVSESRLVRAELASKSGNWELHLDSNMIVGSEGAARVYGIAAGEMPYAAIKTIPLQQYRAMLDAEMAALLHGHHGFDVEYRIRAADSGQIKDIHSIASYDRSERVVFGVIQDITERKAIERELERLVQIDALTGVFTRRHFLTLAERELARTARYSGRLAVLMVDVDRFKGVNDTHGHHVGDRALKRIGQVFREVLRDADIVGRMGGEEFAIILPESAPEQAMEAAERLRGAVERATVSLEHAGVLRLTVSIGVAPLSEAKPSIDALLSQADRALYEAKHRGRNRCCLFDTSECVVEE